MKEPVRYFINPDDVARKIAKFFLNVAPIVLLGPPDMVSVLSHISPLKRYVVELDRVELSFPWASLIVISSANYRW